MKTPYTDALADVMQRNPDPFARAVASTVAAMLDLFKSLDHKPQMDEFGRAPRFHEPGPDHGIELGPMPPHPRGCFHVGCPDAPRWCDGGAPKLCGYAGPAQRGWRT